jgi:mono/diheme cytochrome c family protein
MHQGHPIRWLPFAVSLFGVLAVAALTAEDEPTAAVGSALYKTYCAVCHGPAGKGDGPLAEHLRFLPPDLTKFASRNAGEYPADRVFRMIDGRDPVKGHGGPDMPVWGDAFKNTREGFDEGKVKVKVKALVQHIATIQDVAKK